MSLATTGGVGGAGLGVGAGGGGGIALAHHVGGAIGVAPNHIPHPPPNVSSTGGGAPLPPRSAAALGADLVDKQQAISLKQIKNVSHLPLVAIDLHASEPIVSMYPKKPDDPTTAVLPTMIGKMKSDLYFKQTEAAHKTLRKYLASSKTYASLAADALAKPTDAQAVMLKRPQRWLGLRSLKDAPDFYKQGILAEEASTPAIAEEALKDPGASVANSTLDGSVPLGDDFDRVVCKLRLHTSKKALTILPEEAVQILFHQAQYHVANKIKVTDLSDPEITEYPLVLPTPAWAAHDAAVEALLDATGSASNGVILPRSVCALSGALLPRVVGELTPLLSRLGSVRATMQRAFQIRQVKEPDLIFEDIVVVILMGITDEGFECTAVELSHWQGDLISCLYGDFRVLSNVSYQNQEPLSVMTKCIHDLEESLERVAGDSDGPAAIIFYGAATPQQEKMIVKWDEIKDTTKEWGTVPVITTKPDCVANGAAILGAVSHGRIVRVGTSGSNGKPGKAELAIRLHSVAPVAVGIAMHYHGGHSSHPWTPIKTIFDFDKRVPAGPYPFEFTAAECAVHRAGSKDLSDEELIKATKKNEGSRKIPVREEAALNFQIQVYQKWTRDGEWKKVGDPMEPLVKEEEDEGAQGQKTRIACEQIELQISLGATGMITTNLVGLRESVAQAYQSAKWDRFWNILVIVFCVLFFGGFLARSYWEEYSLERDTKRLLAYYQYAIPGTIADGDQHNARYLVYKYRHKKQALWKLLEKKYGIPVREAHEWEGYEAETVAGNGDETVDLDDDDDGEKDQHELEDLVEATDTSEGAAASPGDASKADNEASKEGVDDSSSEGHEASEEVVSNDVFMDAERDVSIDELASESIVDLSDQGEVSSDETLNEAGLGDIDDGANGLRNGSTDYSDTQEKEEPDL